MISKAIKKLRQKAGLTQEEVAKKARTPRSYISQIESGVRSPSERIAEDILMKGLELTYSKAQQIIKQWKLEKVGMPQELQPIAETEFVAIPILCSVPCGEPEEIEEVYEEADAYMSLPQFKLPKDHQLFAIRAEGLSMMGENIAPGDIAICDGDAKVKSGDLTVVKVNSGFTLKRYFLEDGYVKLQPGNKGFKPLEASQLEIVAKVVYLLKKC